MPFTPAQFFDVFRQYNEAIWPSQILLLASAVAAVVLAFRDGRRAAHLLSGILGLLWLWMGLVYHIGFFRAINPAALAFGTLFLVQGGLFLRFAVRKPRLAFRVRGDAHGVVGGLLIAYAVVVYPVVGYYLGHRYPGAPTFGVPCPTTIFTFGLLLWARPHAPRSLVVVPALWALVATVGALQLGVPEDFGLLVAAAIAVPMILLGGGRRALMHAA
jgi:hypothetical protein